MRPSELRRRLAADEMLLGFAHTLASPALTELLAGFCDFIWVDGQHGEFTECSAQQAVRIIDLMGVTTLLRVPTHDPGILGRYADMAPTALLIPMVDSAEQAAACVSAVRYPPAGQRSFGGRRAVDRYGRQQAISEEPVLLVQIETRQALDTLEAIARTPGVDGLFFGPDDLRLQMGISVDTPISEHEGLRTAMARVATEARAAGKCAATIAGAPESAIHLHQLGYRMLVIGSDIGFLKRSAVGCADGFRRAVEANTEA